MDISSKISEFKTSSFTKKMNLFSFLEKVIIYKDLSVNDYVTNEILSLERREDISQKYTYWLDGGLSWFYWYNQSFDINKDNFDESISMSICNLKFHYLFNDFNIWHEKIMRLYQIVFKLNNFLKEKGIICEIQCTNFDYNPSAIPAFDSFYSFQIDSKNIPFYNIKLVFKSYEGPLKMQQGGAKAPKKIKKEEFIRALQQLKKVRTDKKEEVNQLVLSLNNFKEKLPDFDFTSENIELLKDKIFVEFQLDYYHPTKQDRKPFNIKTFREFYLVKESKEMIRTEPVEIYPNIYNRTLLNKLNDFGLITFSILNTSKADTKIEAESEINIDNIRQKLFINKFLNLTESQFNDFIPNLDAIYQNLFKSDILTRVNYNDNKEIIAVAILEITVSYYNILYSKFLNYNLFFTERVNNFKYEIVYNYYTKFIDFIDKYFMILFRPVVNAFIREINNELYEKHKVKLFIAGGDSMRRYIYNSSFTADIDTKLHFNNAQPDPAYPNQTPYEIKQSIHTIVMKHIVILRNYFEINKIQILSDFISDKNKGFSVFKCNENGINVDVDVLIDNNQQFRTRKIDENKAMPVDLYSIDFRYTVKLTDNATPNKYRTEFNFKRQVALLDIVFGPDKDLYETDFIEIDGVAHASKSFLLKDFETTYTTEKMALGRISNGKVEKDIIRYNQIRDETIATNISDSSIKEVSKEISDLLLLKDSRSDLQEFYNNLKLNQRLNLIIQKIREEKQLTGQDLSAINLLSLNEISKINNHMPKLGKLLSEIWKFEKIPKQLRDLIEYKEQRGDLKEFYEKLKKNPQINNLINKIANKERFNIQDFFIINSLCKNEFSNITFDEIKAYLPDIAKLFSEIMEFKVNLPYENLNSYDINYNAYYQSVIAKINENPFYIVFEKMCNSYLIDNEEHNTFTHAVSYSNSVIEKIAQKNIDLMKSTDVKKACIIAPSQPQPQQKASSTVKLTPAEEAKKKEEMSRKRKESALAKKLAEEERKKAEEEKRKAQSSSRSARALARNSTGK